MSFEKFALRSLRMASAHGCKGSGVGDGFVSGIVNQTPEKSGLPSGIRGVGPVGTGLARMSFETSLMLSPSAGPKPVHFIVISSRDAWPARTGTPCWRYGTNRAILIETS